jgi:hypothetical protein
VARQKFLLVRDYLATALGIATALSHQAASLIIPLTIMWFLHWLSPTLALRLTRNEIMNVCLILTPSRNVIMDAATDVLMDAIVGNADE